MDTVRTLTSLLLCVFACACVVVWASWYNDRAFGFLTEFNPIHLGMFPGADSESRAWTAVGFCFVSFLVAWAIYPPRRRREDD